MALTRRSTARVTANIWPGFVDAVTSLLMVMTFVLTIFIVVQYVLREEISGQESQLNDLSAEIAGLTQALGIATDRADRLEDQRDTLAAQTERQSALVNALQAQVDRQSGQIASFEEQVASLLAQRDTDRSRIASLESERDTLMSEQDALNLALAQARDEIDAGAEQARLAAARREALEALVATLETEAQERDATITSLESALSEEETARLAEAAAAEALRDRLADSDAELTAMTLALEEQRKQAEETLSLLAAAQAAEETLNARLTAALVAQESITDERDDLNRQLVASQSRAAELEGSDAALRAALAQYDEQSAEMAAISDALEAAKAAKIAFQGDLDEARSRLAEAEAEVAALRETVGREAEERDRLAAALADARAEAAALETAQDVQADLRAQLEQALALKLRAENRAEEQMTEAERQAVLLQTARKELSEQEAIASDTQREVAALNNQVAELRSQLSSLQALLDIADEADAESQVRMETLSQQLNAALARAAIEQKRIAELEAAERERLERYQSEFFGRLREVLGDRDGVQIVGDRFVFSSEVLFPSGSANLSSAGRAQVREVAALLNEVSDEIPDNIDWVIRVDGHTDDVPISGTGKFRDNWELSQARALSVVRFMADDLGFPAWRLAPTGFGEFRPVDPRQTPDARAANRRIELKLTER